MPRSSVIGALSCLALASGWRAVYSRDMTDAVVQWFAKSAVLAFVVIAMTYPTAPHWLSAALTVGIAGVSTAMVVIAVHREIQRRKCQRLIDDADIQHAAWRAGDDHTAVFGRFQPPWMVLHSDGCTSEQCICPDRKVSP